MKTPYIMLTKSSLHIVIEILRLPQTYLIVSDSDGHVIRMWCDKRVSYDKLGRAVNLGGKFEYNWNPGGAAGRR